MTTRQLGSSTTSRSSSSSSTTTGEREVTNSIIQANTTSRPFQPTAAGTRNERKNVSTGAAVAIAVVLAVTMAVLIMLAAHQRHRKRRRALSQAIQNSTPGPTVVPLNTGAADAEMAQSRPSPNIPSRDHPDGFAGGYHPSYVNFEPLTAPTPGHISPPGPLDPLSALPGSVTHTSETPNPNPDLAPNTHPALSLTIPSSSSPHGQGALLLKPYDYSIAPYRIHAQKETHLPGSYRGNGYLVLCRHSFHAFANITRSIRKKIYCT